MKNKSYSSKSSWKWFTVWNFSCESALLGRKIVRTMRAFSTAVSLECCVCCGNTLYISHLNCFFLGWVNGHILPLDEGPSTPKSGSLSSVIDASVTDLIFYWSRVGSPVPTPCSWGALVQIRWASTLWPFQRGWPYQEFMLQLAELSGSLRHTSHNTTARYGQCSGGICTNSHIFSWWLLLGLNNNWKPAKSLFHMA